MEAAWGSRENGVVQPDERLRSGNLTLRRYRRGDAPALHVAILESLEELRPWMPWAAAEPLSVSDREALITTMFDRGWDEGTDFTYGMFAGGQVVGGCGLHRRIGPDGLEIGYWVRTTHTGRGVATAAAGLLARAALRMPGVDHVEIHHDKANPASGRVAAKLGFVLRREVPDAVSAPGESGVSCEWRLQPVASRA